MLSIFNKIKELFFLDFNESYFKSSIYSKKTSKIISSKKKDYILYNACEDYYSLCFGYLLSQENKYKKFNFIFYLPELSFYNADPKTNLFKFIFKFYYKNLILYLRNNKWKNLYNTYGLDFISFNNFNILKEINNLKKAYILKKKIKDHNDLLNFSYKEIKVGNLIYDTYLRFNKSATLNIDNFFLIELLAKVINSYEKLTFFQKEKNISEFYTKQVAYIQHGLVSRFLINNKKIVKFTGGKSVYISTYNQKNYFNPLNFRNYKFFFKTLQNKKNRLLEAKKLLKYKFSGKIIPQENWMPFSVYSSKAANLKISNIKVIIFLHCFVDCPTSRGKFIFTDFADWINQTLLYFKNKNLADVVAIKPHPYVKSGSNVYVNKLKKNYPEFQWIHEKTPNNYIFSKKPIIGLSVLGSVLPELAYHGIAPIAAGTHLSMAYNFVFTPRTISDYFQLIDLGLKNKLKLPKNYKSQIYEYYYCDFIYDKPENDNLLAKKLSLKDLNFTKSEILVKFIKRIL